VISLAYRRRQHRYVSPTNQQPFDCYYSIATHSEQKLRKDDGKLYWPGEERVDWSAERKSLDARTSGSHAPITLICIVFLVLTVINVLAQAFLQLEPIAFGHKARMTVSILWFPLIGTR
jgi:hypothetical protein